MNYYFQIITVKESSVSFLGTKQEIKMKKAEPGAWAKLDIPKVNEIYPIFTFFCDSSVLLLQFSSFLHSSWEQEHQRPKICDLFETLFLLEKTSNEHLC